MFAIAKQAGHLVQVLRAKVPLNGLFDRFPHKSAAPSRSGDGIDLADDRVVELNVHSHIYIYRTNRWASFKERWAQG